MINFPSSPTAGQLFNAGPGLSFIFQGGAWTRAPMNTALPKNYIINGGMMVSEQNGSTASALAATLSYYAADQWLGRWAVTGSTLNFTRWDGQNTITGSKTVYLGNNTAVINPTTTASEYALITQHIEGQRVADLMWGTPNAVPIVVRFSVAANAGAGPYGFRIANSDSSRSYVAMWNSNSWGEVVIPIPGDTTGTWLTDTGTGMRLDWSCSIGTTFHGVLGWQAGNKYTTSSQFNGLGVTSGTSNFHLNSVGLYADPYQTGVPPPYEILPYPVELRKSQRYWFPCYGASGAASAATTTSRLSTRNPAPLRIAPVLANCSIVGTPRSYDGTSDTAMTSISAFVGNTLFSEFNTASTGGTMTGGRRCIMYNYSAGLIGHYFAVNVRNT